MLAQPAAPGAFTSLFPLQHLQKEFEINKDLFQRRSAQRVGQSPVNTRLMGSLLLLSVVESEKRQKLAIPILYQHLANRLGSNNESGYKIDHSKLLQVTCCGIGREFCSRFRHFAPYGAILSSQAKEHQQNSHGQEQASFAQMITKCNCSFGFANKDLYTILLKSWSESRASSPFRWQ